MQDLTQLLRETAEDLLKRKAVGVVIGYGHTGSRGDMTAVFARTPQQVSQLALDGECYRNLAVYLNKPEVRKLGRCAIVVKGCDRRAINVLIRENQIAREDLHIIGITCEGVGDPKMQKCRFCTVHNPPDCDTVLGDPVDIEPEEGEFAAVEAFETKDIDARWNFWKEKLKDCIRCYACRQVCPLCYCKQCVVEKNIPQWVETSSHLRGNVMWNVMRAFHLTGRCIGCGECERVCPVGIPLGLLNQKLIQQVKDKFEFTSGMSADEKGPFSTFDLGLDTDDGIL
ncbi:MAG: Fe-S oxidoreductase [Kiritimatiellaeota bacterium]|nr:Fe-S oxidoreductase [Kiritimatiellota bacterium]